MSDYMRRAVGSSGHLEPAEDGSGTMPEKIAGRHRWIATAVHALTDSQAAAQAAGARVDLTIESLIFIGVGCVDCEQGYEEARLERCAAGDEWSRE